MEFQNFCCCWSISPTCSSCTFSTRCRSALQICTRLVQYYFERTANFQGHPTSSCGVTTSLSQFHQQQQQHTSRYSPRNFGVSDLNNYLWDFVHSRSNLLGIYLFYSLLYLNFLNCFGSFDTTSQVLEFSILDSHPFPFAFQVPTTSPLSDSIIPQLLISFLFKTALWLNTSLACFPQARPRKVQSPLTLLFCGIKSNQDQPQDSKLVLTYLLIGLLDLLHS